MLYLLHIKQESQQIGENMESYVIRIYRRDEHNPHGIIGLVEDIELDSKTPFHNTQELAEILTGEGKDAKNKIEREKRMIARLNLRLSARVDGMDDKGRKFTEDAAISNISSYGAYINIKNQVSKDARVFLTIDPEDSCLNMKARVVRIENGKSRTGIGVAFI